MCSSDGKCALPAGSATHKRAVPMAEALKTAADVDDLRALVASKLRRTGSPPDAYIDLWRKGEELKKLVGKRDDGEPTEEDSVPNSPTAKKPAAPPASWQHSAEAAPAATKLATATASWQPSAGTDQSLPHDLPKAVREMVEVVEAKCLRKDISTPPADCEAADEKKKKEAEVEHLEMEIQRLRAAMAQETAERKLAMDQTSLAHEAERAKLIADRNAAEAEQQRLLQTAALEQQQVISEAMEHYGQQQRRFAAEKAQFEQDRKDLASRQLEHELSTSRAKEDMVAEIKGQFQVRDEGIQMLIARLENKFRLCDAASGHLEAQSTATAEKLAQISSSSTSRPSASANSFVNDIGAVDKTVNNVVAPPPFSGSRTGHSSRSSSSVDERTI